MQNIYIYIYIYIYIVIYLAEYLIIICYKNIIRIFAIKCFTIEKSDKKSLGIFKSIKINHNKM